MVCTGGKVVTRLGNKKAQASWAFFITGNYRSGLNVVPFSDLLAVVPGSPLNVLELINERAPLPTVTETTPPCRGRPWSALNLVRCSWADHGLPLRRGDGESEMESNAVAFDELGFDVSSKEGHNFFGGRKSDAGTIGFGGVHALEETFHETARDAAGGIFDSELRMVIVIIALNIDFTFAF